MNFNSNSCNQLASGIEIRSSKLLSNFKHPEHRLGIQVSTPTSLQISGEYLSIPKPFFKQFIMMKMNDTISIPTKNEIIIPTQITSTANIADSGSNINKILIDIPTTDESLEIIIKDIRANRNISKQQFKRLKGQKSKAFIELLTSIQSVDSCLLLIEATRNNDILEQSHFDFIFNILQHTSNSSILLALIHLSHLFNESIQIKLFYFCMANLSKESILLSSFLNSIDSIIPELIQQNSTSIRLTSGKTINSFTYYSLLLLQSQSITQSLSHFQQLMSQLLVKDKKDLLTDFMIDLLYLIDHLEWPIALLLAMQLSKFFTTKVEMAKPVTIDWLGKFSILLRNRLQIIDKNADQSGNNGVLESNYSKVCNWIKSLNEDQIVHKIAIDYNRKLLIHFLGSRLDKECIQRLEAETPLCTLTTTSSLNSQQALDSYRALQNCYPLNETHDKIVLFLVRGIDSEVITSRTKSIRSLSILLRDPLVSDKLQNAILASLFERLNDSAATVRDSVVEVLSRYLLQDYIDLTRYYQSFSERICDVSTSVRKRMIKFLRDAYSIINKKLVLIDKKDTVMNSAIGNNEVCVDVLLKLLARLDDSEDTVVDLTLKILIDLMFPAPQVFGEEWDDWDTSSRSSMICNMVVISDVLVRVDTKEFMKKARKEEGQKVCARIGIMVSALMEKISIPSNAFADLEISVGALLIISRSFSETITPHLHQLNSLMRLKRSSTPEQMRLTVLTIEILSNCISHSDQSDFVLLHEIEIFLLSHLTQSSIMIKASSACLCAIAKITKMSDCIERVTVKCISTLQPTLKAIKNLEMIDQSKITAVLKCLLIASTIISKFDFQECEKHPVELLRILGSRNIRYVFFEMLVNFCEYFREHPSIAVVYDSLWAFCFSNSRFLIISAAIDQISWVFDYGSPTLKQEFLVYLGLYIDKEQSQSDDTPANMQILVGDSDIFCSEGIPASLLQNYVDKVINCMLSGNMSLTKSAFAVILLALKYGLIHPITCVPGLVAMESCPDVNIARNALISHKQLVEKYSSFIHSKNMEAVALVYHYQTRLSTQDDVNDSYQSSISDKLSFINDLYGLIRQSRLKRNDFLKSLITVFEVSHDLAYIAFVAKNIAYLNFEIVEEVLHIIHLLNLIILSRGHELHDLVDQDMDGKHHSSTIDSCVSLTHVITLRQYLQRRYQVSVEDSLPEQSNIVPQSQDEKKVSVDLSAEVNFSSNVNSQDIIIRMYDQFVGEVDMNIEEYTPKKRKARGTSSSKRQRREIQL